ncbi:hypothetical protein D3C87_2049220 [compost metagenome]
MKLVGLEHTQHPRLDGVAVVIDDHGAFALVDPQKLHAQVGVEGFLMLVIHTLALIGKLQGLPAEVAHHI